MAESTRPICVLTGGNGYVGSRLVPALAARGFQLRLLQRRTPVEPISGAEHIPFTLGEPPAESAFDGAEVLIHCAYDMKLIPWTEIQRVNVDGSNLLLESARRAGVKRIIFISSISAYEGCHSLYGKAKLAVEHRALALGGCVVRPGLVYGDQAGGMFGSLRGLVQRVPIIPLIAGNKQLHLCHEADLSRLIADLADGSLPLPTTPLTAADTEGITFRRILEILAKQYNRNPLFIPLPWQLAWLGLKVAECVGVRIGFKSDSLVSLVHPNPRPDFEFQRTTDLRFQAFR